MPPTAVRVIHMLSQQALDTHAQLQEIKRALVTLQRTDEVARRLATIPGIGLVNAMSLTRRAGQGSTSVSQRLANLLARKPVHLSSGSVLGRRATAELNGL